MSAAHDEHEQIVELLPHDRQAEHACLSAIYARGLEALDELNDAGVRDPAAFFVPAYAAVFTAILDCIEAELPITADTIASEMRRRGSFDRLNGKRVLASLADGVTTRTREFAAIVSRDHRRRDANRTLRELAGISMRETDMTKVIAAARRELDRLDAAEANLCVPISVAVSETRAQLERRSKGAERLVSSGFAALDDLGEAEPGDLVIVGAESGTGKTAFALGLARNGLWTWDGTRNVRLREQEPVLFISGEMGLDKLVMRWVSDMTGFDGRLLKRPDAQWLDASCGPMTNRRVLDDAFNTLSSVELSLTRPKDVRTIDMVGAISRAWASRMQRRYGKGVPLKIIVDYLQLLKHQGRHRNMRSDEIEGDKAGELKALAEDTQSVVIALSQITFKDKTKDRRPSERDLYGSGMIRNHADRIWLLYRPWICQEDVGAVEGEYRRLRHLAEQHGPGVPFQGHARFEELHANRSYAEVGIGKARGGAAFSWVPLEFTPELTRFLDLPKDRQRQFGGRNW